MLLRCLLFKFRQAPCKKSFLWKTSHSGIVNFIINDLVNQQYEFELFDDDDEVLYLAYMIYYEAFLWLLLRIILWMVRRFID